MYYKLPVIILSIISILLLKSSNEDFNSKIIYSFDVSDDYLNLLKKNKNTNMIWLYSVVKESASNLNLNLIFNSEESLFYADNLMVLDTKNSFDMSISLLNAKGKTYSNIEENEKIRSCDAYGENFYIKSNFYDNKWNISKIKKKILNKDCYYATSIINIENSSGRFKKEIKAWFCPELPYNFGPSGFNGLPGLIMEIEFNGLLVKVKELSLLTEKPKDLKAQLKKGIKVTEEEFLNYGKKVDSIIRSQKRE